MKVVKVSKQPPRLVGFTWKPRVPLIMNGTSPGRVIKEGIATARETNGRLVIGSAASYHFIGLTYDTNQGDSTIGSRIEDISRMVLEFESGELKHFYIDPSQIHSQIELVPEDKSCDKENIVSIACFLFACRDLIQSTQGNSLFISDNTVGGHSVGVVGSNKFF